MGWLHLHVNNANGVPQGSTLGPLLFKFIANYKNTTRHNIEATFVSICFVFQQNFFFLLQQADSKQKKTFIIIITVYRERLLTNFFIFHLTSAVRAFVTPDS